MAVDVEDLLRRGNAELHGLLDFCVFSVQLEPVFALLVREYRRGSTAARAMALYELFCAPGAPARIHAAPALPPYDLRLPRAVEALRQPADMPTASEGADAGCVMVPAGPAKHLFDFVVDHLRQGPNGRLRLVGQQFDPGRTPVDNLPGGRMTPGQWGFVEHAWRPRVRPALVAAGFWRVATVGN